MSSPAGSRFPIDVALTVMDFPGILNPVFVRDLRRELRTEFFVWCLALLQAIALLTALFHWMIIELSWGPGAGSLLSGAFNTLTTLAFSFLFPLSHFNALQAELGKDRNVELLLTSRLSRWQIVSGKFCVATILSGLLLISLLPYYLIHSLLGGAEMMGIPVFIFSLWVSNAVMSAMVIGASAVEGVFGRILVIVFLMIFYDIATATPTTLTVFAGKLNPHPSGEFIYGCLLATLSILISLQIGRSKLKLYENPLNPPATALIFLFIVLAFFILNVVSTLNSGISQIVLLATLIPFAFLMDREPRFKNQLKACPA